MAKAKLPSKMSGWQCKKVLGLDKCFSGLDSFGKVNEIELFICDEDTCRKGPPTEADVAEKEDEEWSGLPAYMICVKCGKFDLIMGLLKEIR